MDDVKGLRRLAGGVGQLRDAPRDNARGPAAMPDTRRVAIPRTTDTTNSITFIIAKVAGPRVVSLGRQPILKQRAEVGAEVGGGERACQPNVPKRPLAGPLHIPLRTCET